MNKREKGNRAERDARDVYEAAGFTLDRVGSTAGGYRMTDAFGQVDIVALHPDRRVRVAQVKSNTAGGVRAFVEWAADTLPLDHATADFLIRHDGAGSRPPAWRLQRPHETDGGVTYRTVVDERKMDVAMGEGVAEYLRGEA